VVIVDLLDSSGGFQMISVKIATEVLVELHKEKHILLYKETVLKEERLSYLKNDMQLLSTSPAANTYKHKLDSLNN
jgi:hypothetical protein